MIIDQDSPLEDKLLEIKSFLSNKSIDINQELAISLAKQLFLYQDENKNLIHKIHEQNITIYEQKVMIAFN